MRTQFKLAGGLSALGLLAIVLAIEPAQAQNRTQNAPPQDRAAQEAACGGDATRFCGPMIPDEQKIAACLRANQDKISPACRAILR